MHDTLNEFDLLARDLADASRKLEIQQQMVLESEREFLDIQKKLVELAKSRTTLGELQVLSLGRLVDLDLEMNTARLVPLRTSKSLLNGGLAHDRA